MRVWKKQALGAGALALALMASGCSDPETITVEITTGLETDTFSLDPAVTRVDIAGLDAGGGTVLSATTEPGGAFSLGEIPVDEFLRFEVTGLDAAGNTQVRGRSLGLVLGAIDGDIFPVFAQRVMRWSRPPGALPFSHDGGLGAVLGERYLMVTGGEGLGTDAAATQFYDLLALGGAQGGVLGLVPQSLAVSADANALFVMDQERALWIDFDSGESAEITPPSEIGAWSQIAGGRTVVSEGATYIVGPTRSGEPSDRILVIANDRTVTGARTIVARSGAAAAYIPDVGLSILGGSEAEPGVEVLADGETTASARPFPADLTAGATAVLGTQSREALLFCGEDADGPAAVRAFDLGCGADCEPREVEDLDLGTASMKDCTAFTLDGGRTLLAGTGDDDLMTAMLLATTSGEVTPLPLREPRRGAVVVPTPTGTVGILGGVLEDGTPALSVELLWPE